MGLFRRKPAAAKAGEDHAVLIHFALSEEFGTEAERTVIGDLGDRLADVVERAGAGEFDGDEYGNGEASLYLYGPDLERLWTAVEADVRACAVRPAFVQLRPGGPDVPARRLDL